MSGVNIFLQKNIYRLLILGYAIAYLLPLINRRLWSPDETRYAEISREMIQSGDWVVPRLLGLDYFEKPILGYWLNSISQLLFGETHFAVRFASAFCTGLTAMLIYWFSKRLFQSPKKAIASAVIYLSSFIVYAIGTYSVLDAMVSLWLNLTLVSFYISFQANSPREKKIGYGVMGFAIGLGFLTKGFIALVVPGIVILPYLIYRHQLNELRFVWIVFVTMLLVTLPWAIAVHLRAPDFWHYFFWVEHVQRFASEDAQHKAPFWYYVPVVIVGCLPWLGLLPAVFKQGWNNVQLRTGVIFLLCWLIIPFVFFSMANGKLLTYILLCFAPLAIIIGNGLVELLEKKMWQSLRLNGWINIFFGGVIALLVVLAGCGVIGRQAIYEPFEYPIMILAIVIFLAWSLWGAMSIYKPVYSLWLTALCPLFFGLLLGYVIPQSSVYAKLPETFIHENQQRLAKSRFIFCSDPGLATALAWELKRDDIRLFRIDGEFAYGLQSAKQSDKFLVQNTFAPWLVGARLQGDVAVVRRLERGEILTDLPAADEVINKLRFSIYYYNQIAEQSNKQSAQ